MIGRGFQNWTKVSSDHNLDSIWHMRNTFNVPSFVFPELTHQVEIPDGIIYLVLGHISTDQEINVHFVAKCIRFREGEG